MSVKCNRNGTVWWFHLNMQFKCVKFSLKEPLKIAFDPIARNMKKDSKSKNKPSKIAAIWWLKIDTGEETGEM